MPNEGERRDLAANLHYAGKYRGTLEEAQRTGQCVFCEEEFRKRALSRVDDWFICKSQYPTKDREKKDPEHHFLIVPYAHSDGRAALRPEDWHDIEVLRRWVDEQFGIRGGGICVRLGDPSVCGRTVPHPHVHYIVPRMVKDEKTGEMCTRFRWIFQSGKQKARS